MADSEKVSLSVVFGEKRLWVLSKRSRTCEITAETAVAEYLSANFALDLARPISLDSRTIAVRRCVLIALEIGTESSMEGRLGK